MMRGSANKLLSRICKICWNEEMEIERSALIKKMKEDWKSLSHKEKGKLRKKYGSIQLCGKDCGCNPETGSHCKNEICQCN